ncbi:conserved domain protein [delta proteobacterium NaphS2]|nr:conserved domain protein [delta proteobacterium NaphS2]
MVMYRWNKKTKVSPFLNLFQFFQPVPRIFFIMRREFWHEK